MNLDKYKFKNIEMVSLIKIKNEIKACLLLFFCEDNDNDKKIKMSSYRMYHQAHLIINLKNHDGLDDRNAIRSTNFLSSPTTMNRIQKPNGIK